MDYFGHLQQLLTVEEAADQESYATFTARSSMIEKRAGGWCWYPIAIRDTEMSRGDYLVVELERTTHQDLVHQFRFGASVSLFSNHNPAQDTLQGVISYIGGNKMKITLRTDDLPDWSRQGKLGVQLLFDSNSYQEMRQALKLAAQLAEKEEEGSLVRLLTTDSLAEFNPPAALAAGNLNSSQQDAVQKIVTAKQLAIVHGPPGTGKTTTLVQAILEMLRLQPAPILVTAPSNAAVDLLTEKLAESGLNVVRVGNPARVSDRLMELTLDGKISSHPQMKEMKRLKRQAAEYRDLAHKYKRNFGKAERDQRKALFDEARKIVKEIGNTEEYIIADLLGKAQVITATLVGANHHSVKHLRYETVIIDEAGQALEPACWIPILKGKKLVLAGDHCQLPPTLKSEQAARNGLAITLLEKLVSQHPNAVALLQEQYRMNRLIMGYSAAVFYEGKLKAHPSVANQQLLPEETPLLFIDTAGCGYEEVQDGHGISNPEEASFLQKHIERLLASLPPEMGKPTVAIISPYKHQVELLKALFSNAPNWKERSGQVTINTIDSFQGQERDIVYISLARSNADSRIGFLSEIRRMNVAMTRARKKLVVIGDSSTLSQHAFYAGFIEYASQHDAYHSAWEFMDL